jgi:hypothetical protein
MLSPYIPTRLIQDSQVRLSKNYVGTRPGARTDRKDIEHYASWNASYKESRDLDIYHPPTIKAIITHVKGNYLLTLKIIVHLNQFNIKIRYST